MDLKNKLKYKKKQNYYKFVEILKLKNLVN